MQKIFPIPLALLFDSMVSNFVIHPPVYLTIANDGENSCQFGNLNS